MATIRDKKMEIKSPSIHSRLLLSVPITAQICAKSLDDLHRHLLRRDDFLNHPRIHGGLLRPQLGRVDFKNL
jgi:hypothetical protein